MLEQEEIQEGVKFSICGRKERKRTEFMWRSKPQESSAQEETICAIRSRAKNPSAIRMGEDVQSLVSGVCAQEEQNWTIGY